jgi:hypothetical protein
LKSGICRAKSIRRSRYANLGRERQENTYTIRNRDASAREVVIEHPARPGWKLTDDEKPAESSASFHRFQLTVEPKKTTTWLVKEYRPISNRYHSRT